MTKLKSYRDKRDLDTSGEPAGKATNATSGHRYVLHKHDASQLHYDLRLEQDGVLRSWALPKGPSLQVGDKRLAIEVDDHPLEYGDFEGVIPADAYGGGTVMVWDYGTWATMDNNKSGQIDFVLDGEKLKGAWTLVRMSRQKNGQKNKSEGSDDKQNWLLIKRHDSETHTQDAETLDALGSRSARSDRSMEVIATDGDDDRDQPSARKIGATARPDPTKLDGARKQQLTSEPKPQLATLTDSAPQGDDWLHEFKFDGYRLLARLKNGRVQLLTRNGKDWADRFAGLAAAVERLPADEAILDGEAVAFNSDGISDFGRLQKAIGTDNTDAVVYQVFDLLHLDGTSLKSVAQIERKQVLAQLLESCGDDRNHSHTIRYTDDLAGHGPAFYRKACRLGLEGIICKRADSAYASGRSKHWLKVKCVRDDEFVVGGYTDPEGSRIGFGSLLLGAYDDAGHLVYSGRIGTGFSDRQLNELSDKLRKIVRRTSPFCGKVPDTHTVHWVRPSLVIEAKYTERTRDKRLRHPVFRGLREDRNADEIHLPQENHAAESKRMTALHNPSRQRGTTVAGVRLSHPHRVLYPEMGVTKLDLAQHFYAIRDWIVPVLAGRPLSLVRCPEGQNKECFFQKHPGTAIPEHIPRITITEKKGPREYIYVRSIEDIIGLVQAGTLEFHVWGSRVDDIERPDSLVFDLDPAPGVVWKETVRVARRLGERLDELGLSSFVRVTGGKGLHLVVPLTRHVEWDDAKAFAHAVAQQYARAEPKRLITNMSRDKRRGRVFIDYLRNARGATAIASYSPRAREGAPVAVPIRWDELGSVLYPDRYRLDNLRRRLSALGDDPWAGYTAARCSLNRKMLRAVGVN